MEHALKLEHILSSLYDKRFSPQDTVMKARLWDVLVREFLQEHVGYQKSVLDIGGGYCEFLNSIAAREKHLIDLNPRASEFAKSDIKIHHLDVTQATPDTFGAKVDCCFVSNFFEHLPNFQELLRVLGFVHSILNPGGKLIIIQPNYRFAYREYFDFIDHMLPISDKSLREAMEASGFEVETLIPRFLPFSTKSRAASPLALKVYLRMPWIWSFFGKQLFMVAKRS